jgi:hypothetical protein
MSENKTSDSYACGMCGGDCPIGMRDNENMCLHKKWCSKKIMFGVKNGY